MMLSVSPMGALDLPCTATPADPPDTHPSPRASDRTSINVMCGINLFCMFLLISMIAFVGAIISTCCFVAFLGTLYSDIIGISQFVRLLVIVCRSCCCEYVRNSSPVKTQQPLYCKNDIPSTRHAAGASTSPPKHAVGVSPDLPLWVWLNARDVRRLHSCARPRPA